MPRKKSTELTERESEIMEILWSDGLVTSEHIRKQMSGKPHDSSVRTMLRILIEKGYVRSERDQRPALYKALVKKNRAQDRAVSNLLQRLFSGSAESLVLRLLEDKKISVEQLEQIKRTVRDGKKGGGK